MKILFIITLSFCHYYVAAQRDSCKIYREAFSQVAVRLPPKLQDSVSIERFDKLKLAQMRHILGYDRATGIILWIQSSLDHYNEAYNNKEYWRLNNLEDTFKMLDRLRKECPTINLKVYEDELAFYDSKYRPYDPSRARNEQ